MQFIIDTTLDRRGRRSLQIEIYFFMFHQQTNVRLLPLFRHRFYKDTYIQTSKGNIATGHIKTKYQHPQEVLLVLFFQEKNRKRVLIYIFPQTAQKLFRTVILGFIPLKFRQKSIFFSVFPAVYQSYQHTFPQVVEKSTVALNKYTGQFVKINTRLNIEVFGKLRVLFDELTAGLNGVSHKKREHRVARHSVLDGDLEERSLLGVHRGLPELLGVHLT